MFGDRKIKVSLVALSTIFTSVTLHKRSFIVRMEVAPDLCNAAPENEFCLPVPTDILHSCHPEGLLRCRSGQAPDRYYFDAQFKKKYRSFALRALDDKKRRALNDN